MRRITKAIAAVFLAAGLLFSAAGLAIGSEGAGVYKKVAGAVVYLDAYNSYGQWIRSGSGVVIARRRVATNCHVVDGASTVSVTQFMRTDNSQHKFEVGAEVAQANRRLDLCILRTDHSLSFSAQTVPVRIGSVFQTSVGDTVYAQGAPKGLRGTFQKGIIAQYRDCLPYFKTCPSGLEPIIQIDMAVSGGFSGGGLFDTSGKLIGIMTYYRRNGKNLSFAIPADWIKRIVHFDNILMENAVIYAERGHTGDAAEVVAQITRRERRARTVLQIVRSLARLNDRAGAKLMLRVAKAVARSVDSAARRASFLSRIAVLEHESGEDAAAGIKEIKDAIVEISDAGSKAVAMLRLSYLEALGGNCGAAKVTLAKAERIKLTREVSKKRVNRKIGWTVRQLQKNVPGCMVK